MDPIKHIKDSFVLGDSTTMETNRPENVTTFIKYKYVLNILPLYMYREI